jgi:hypothetical protein
VINLSNERRLETAGIGFCVKARRVAFASVMALALPFAFGGLLDGQTSVLSGGYVLAADTDSEAADDAATKEEEAKEAEPKEKKKRFSFRRLLGKKDAEATPPVAETEKAEVATAVREGPVTPVKKPMVVPVRKPKLETQVAKVEEGPNSRTITGLIKTYDAYRGDLAFAAQVSFENKSAIREAHKRLAKYDEVTLSRAWVAYNASIAAQTPEFSGEISRKSKKSTDRFLGTLHRKSGNIMKLKSSSKAVRSVLYNVAEETKQLSNMASAYKQISIDLQTGKTTNVSMAKQEAMFINAGYSGDMVTASKKTDLRVAKAAVLSRSRPVLGRMLILGAHISTNNSEGKYKQHTTQLSNHKSGQQCLKWARLNLAQCIAASRDISEEAYCTGRHAINEVSECWRSIALGGSGKPA